MTNPLDPQSDYNVPKGDSKYLKFEKGDTEFLPLDSAVTGWQYWTTDNKPVRVSKEPEDPHTLPDIRVEDGKAAIKHFWAFPVYDYASGKVKVLEITQKSIMNDIRAYTKNPKWGSPVMKYSLTVHRDGDKLDTEYSVMANPVEQIPEAITTAWENAKGRGFKIERLFEGGDPFGEAAEASAA